MKKLSNINLKKIKRPSFTLKPTERDKKLLAVFGIVVLIGLSYLILYRPMSAKTATLQSEKEKVDAKVAEAKSDLENEEKIIQDYTTALDKANIDSASFFPKVYPYKDRYVLLMEKVVTASGIAANMVMFDDPVAGGVAQSNKDKVFVLPEYPLFDLATKINSINATASSQTAQSSVDSKAATNTKATTTKKSDKSLPSDAVLKLPATLEVKGSYAQIRAVIKNMELLNRAVAIEGVAIDKEKEGGLKASFALSFYAVEKVDNGADPFNPWILQGSYGKADIFN